MPIRKLIINADDFGLCDGVNSAVVLAHSEGVLTSTTIMANMPAATEAVKISKTLPGLGVGIHLNLTEGKPLSDDNRVHCLVDKDGFFYRSPFKPASLSLTSSKARQAIAVEMAAQIQWVIDSGIKPTHLDSHKHIHCFPCIYPIVCDLAKRFNIFAIRLPYEQKTLCSKPWPHPSAGGAKRAWAIRIMAGINHRQNPDFHKTNAFYGIAHTGKIDVDFFRACILYDSSSVAELMTHPGFAGSMDAYQTRLREHRESELKALCDERTKQYIVQAGIKLVHYGQL